MNIKNQYVIKTNNHLFIALFRENISEKIREEIKNKFSQSVIENVYKRNNSIYILNAMKKYMYNITIYQIRIFEDQILNLDFSELNIQENMYNLIDLDYNKEYVSFPISIKYDEPIFELKEEQKTNEFFIYKEQNKSLDAIYPYKYYIKSIDKKNEYDPRDIIADLKFSNSNGEYSIKSEYDRLENLIHNIYFRNRTTSKTIIFDFSNYDNGVKRTTILNKNNNIVDYTNIDESNINIDDKLVISFRESPVNDLNELMNQIKKEEESIK